jgi:hypothetical protein
MRNIRICILALFGLILFSACNHHETYADQKKKERAAINQYLVDAKIKVISESTFKQNGYITNVSNNEYVLFENTGVYMQIVRMGCGEKLKNGETANVLCRYNEYNLFTDSLQTSNRVLHYSSRPDKMSVTKNSGTFTASFSYGVMVDYYGTSVPSGWLVPFAYINLGRPVNETDEVAYVKLIVPHSEGQKMATQAVYPCYYEITFERGV